jgi:ABC-type spermidine/putrescine transport system permease subunit II
MLLLPTILAFGFAFLYVPILSMVVYSFNASRRSSGTDSCCRTARSWMPPCCH